MVYGQCPTCPDDGSGNFVGTGKVPDPPDELDRLRAELERMRPVIEAACHWFVADEIPDLAEYLAESFLIDAVGDYQDAVAALDAGEPAGE